MPTLFATGQETRRTGNWLSIMAILLLTLGIPGCANPPKPSTPVGEGQHSVATREAPAGGSESVISAAASVAAEISSLPVAVLEPTTMTCRGLLRIGPSYEVRTSLDGADMGPLYLTYDNGAWKNVSERCKECHRGPNPRHLGEDGEGEYF